MVGKVQEKQREENLTYNSLIEVRCFSLKMNMNEILHYTVDTYVPHHRYKSPIYYNLLFKFTTKWNF